jgi:hypothetical protein
MDLPGMEPEAWAEFSKSADWPAFKVLLTNARQQVLENLATETDFRATQRLQGAAAALQELIETPEMAANYLKAQGNSEEETEEHEKGNRGDGRIASAVRRYKRRLQRQP